MSLDRRTLEKVDAAQRARYDARLDKHGRSARTLGWGDEAQMQARFRAVARAGEPAGKRVLDVGCGFGGLLGYLEETGQAPASYTGWDINPRLLAEVVEEYPEASFEVRNLLVEPPEAPVADVVFMVGISNVRIPEVDPDEYFQGFLEAGLAAAEEALVVNAISALPAPGYPVEDFIAYRHPADVLRRSLELTPFVELFHAEAPVPQQEFTLVLRKAARP